MSVNRSLFSRTIFGAALLVAIFVAILPSHASLGNVSIGCSSTTMEIINPENTNEVENGFLTVTANGDQVAVVSTDPYGLITVTASYSLPDGEYLIVATWTNTSETQIVSDTLSCGAPKPSPSPSATSSPMPSFTPIPSLTPSATPMPSATPASEYGGFCFASGEVASAVYLYPDGLEIYSIANDVGVLSISLSKQALYGFAPDSAGDVVIATADDVLATTLYRQTDGNFRVVVGPEPLEGKTYECVFNVVCSKTRSWLPGQAPSSPLDLSTCVAPVIATLNPTSLPTSIPTSLPTSTVTPIFTPIFTPSIDV